MTTIGQLPPASSVSDSDELAIYQNGNTLSATRAQLLAGTQRALTVPQNTLLGGEGPGTTAPVPINIGANLSISGNTLSAAAAPFVISQLKAGVTPGPNDLVPLGQSGANVAVSYANFLAGLANVSGVPGGGLVATATGGTTARTIDALVANAISIEDFGAKGDGVTDDSAALLAAVASGAPVRLGAKTYAIAGECDVGGAACTLIGVPGLSILKRSAQSKSGTSGVPTWFSFSASTLRIDGVIFDANSTITQTTYGVVVQASCTRSLITSSLFRNAQGAGAGSGLTILSSDPVVTQHRIDHCEFTGNVGHGFYAVAVDALSITNCSSHDNGVDGIFVDSQDQSFNLKIRELHIVGNTCWNNNVGILVGNFVANNIDVQPFVYGNTNPDVLGAVILGNNCFTNKGYGIFISGRNILVSANLCTNNSSVAQGGAGILCDTGYCKITGNMITGASAFGIDCGGSINTVVDNNYINGALYGLNIGGGQFCTARANFIQDCTAIGISVQNVESNGAGDNFNLACNGLSIIGNWINYAGNVIGILVRDNAQNILIEDNIIVGEPGANLTNAISAYTGAVVIRGNVLNYTTRWPSNPALVNGVYTLTYPDAVDAVSISQSSATVTSMVSAQAALAVGTVTYCTLLDVGISYTTATVSFTGTGTGAAATAFISGGKIIGIQMSSFGSGYGAGTTVTITGDGAGASATAQVGLPPPAGRQLSVDCLVATRFADSGAAPAQINWTGAPITVPVGATIDWIGYNGGWRAARFMQSDYVSPNGDGSLTLRTQLGSLSLHPAGAGVVRILSDAESTGASELIGRGSPVNVVSAPAGSTYRNLNGGAGSTFWVNQVTGSGNWVAVA